MSRRTPLKLLTKYRLVVVFQAAERDEELALRISRTLTLSQRQPVVIEETFAIEDDVSEAGENEFPALTDVQEAMVASALVRNPASQVLSEGFKLQLTRADFCTLSGLNWLNDEVS